MGISYEFIGDVAVAQANEVIGKEELERAFTAISSDPHFHSGMIIHIDIRRSVYKSSSEEIRGTASIMKASLGSNSPIAMVAENDACFATGRMLEVFCESEGVVFGVFRKIENAAEWLSESDS